MYHEASRGEQALQNVKTLINNIRISNGTVCQLHIALLGHSYEMVEAALYHLQAKVTALESKQKKNGRRKG